MLLKVGHVFQAAPVITQIINSNRPLPQKGAYRMARLYAKLKPEYDLIVAHRNKMIEEYGHKEMVAVIPQPGGPDPVLDADGKPAMEEAPNFSVPMDKMPEFTAAWAEACAAEIEVAVEAIPLDQLDHITAGELVVLDGLVAE